MTYRTTITDRGRYVGWATAALALFGLETRRNFTFMVFAVGLAMIVVGATFASLPPPKSKLRVRLPLRLTAKKPLTLRVEVEHVDTADPRALHLIFPAPDSWKPTIATEPRAALIPPATDTARSHVVEVTMQAPRRGPYTFRGPTLRALDPLRLYATKPMERAVDHTLLVYPQIYSLDHLPLVTGRRHQPGGVPLAQSTGDAVEFIGTRDYRPGDPVRNIHFRSWARRGTPVVKEHQEEFFCRVAIFLDTSFPRVPFGGLLRPPQGTLDKGARAFEAAVSVAAGAAVRLLGGEAIVDVVAASGALHRVSAGRGLGSLDGLLDVLASLEPARRAALGEVPQELFDELGQLTAVVVVLGDWDADRERLCRRLHDAGIEVTILIVRDGPTTSPVANDVEAVAGHVSLIQVADVERALAETK